MVPQTVLGFGFGLFSHFAMAGLLQCCFTAVIVQGSLEESIKAAGSTSHSPSVISALLVRTFPSINLITAKTVQRIPLRTETLYRKSSWKERKKKKKKSQTLVCLLVLLLITVQIFVLPRNTTWDQDFLPYDFHNIWCLFFTCNCFCSRN